MMLNSFFKENFTVFQPQIAAVIALHGDGSILKAVEASERARIEQLLQRLSALSAEWRREICAEVLLQCSH